MINQRFNLLNKIILKITHNIAIETAKTPNPNFIKFIPVGHSVLGDQGTLDIPSV